MILSYDKNGDDEMEFDFAKNRVVENLDNVPAKYHVLYAEISEGDDTGKFTIGDDFKGIVGDYIGTTKALGETRAANKATNDENAKRRQANKAFEDIMEGLGLDEDSRTADGLQNYINEIASQAKNGKELKINLDKVREEMSKKHAIEMEGKDKDISERDTALEKHLIGDMATRALAEHKGSVELLLPHVKNNCKVSRGDAGEYSVQVLDSAREVRYSGAGNPMTVSELVASMKADEKFARAFESDTPSGGGSRPGSTSSSKGTGSVRDLSREKSAVEKIKSGLDKLQARR